MSMRKLLPTLVLALAASVVVGTSFAAPDRKAPRIVGAAMLDRDGDGRADAVRLMFSERVRHPADRDGKYPFTVVGYKIVSVGGAKGRTLVLVLAEKRAADGRATPLVRYRHTRSKAVRDRAGNQAARQTFRSVRAHGTAAGTTPLPPPIPPPPPPDPALPPDLDPDRDGYQAPLDCQPNDPAIHPGAEDLPDLGFVDSNCDGIDGDEAKAVFASPFGNDANPGTKAQPKRQLAAAILAAKVMGRYVLAAAGTYEGIEVASGVGVYGGYEQTAWSRSTNLTTSIENSAATGAQAVLADAATDVTLQLLTVRGSRQAYDAYGVRAINGSSLRFQLVTVSAGDGAAGAFGAKGGNGLPGGDGANGADGDCDLGTGFLVQFPAAGGSSSAGRTGGAGGVGGQPELYGTKAATPGRTGEIGTPGGPRGGSGNPGGDGKNGQEGAAGAPGRAGEGGSAITTLAGASWLGAQGGTALNGEPGNGGGGGGGGGAQTGLFVIDGAGDAGGGGGGGGAGGGGGNGGRAGGGSFGVYLYNSTLVAERSSIAAGNGGAGGRGGNGGLPGAGGLGGNGSSYCSDEVGEGGDGGRGGNGGPGGGGGGGAGGPSVGIFKAGSSTAALTESTVTNGTAGPGGAGGIGGTGLGGAGAAGIAQPVYPAA